MKNTLFNSPVEDGPHESGEGRQMIYKYPNGYGASVIRFKLPFASCIPVKHQYASHTFDETEWELGFTKHDKTGNWGLFKQEAFGNVMVVGHLKEDQVEEYLVKIKALPKHDLI